MRWIFWWFVFVFTASWLYDNALPIIRASHIDLSSALLGAFGAGVIMVLGHRFIHNWIVEKDRRNDIAGVNKKHDARRI